MSTSSISVQSLSTSSASRQVSPPYERMTYLFGHPIAHSWSPLLHNTLYAQAKLPWHYQLFESISIPSFLELLHDPKCAGSSVTMPHKIAILPYLDSITEEGREVGACNTIFIRPGPNGTRKYIGTNTDVIGIREAFAQNVEGIYKKVSGRPALVLGGGGAARSAVYALNKYFSPSIIYLVNRDPNEVAAVISSCLASGFGSNLIHVQTIEQAEALVAPVIAVGCVPDFPPVTAAEREARAVVELLLSKGDASEKGVILEMAYHPTIWTGLARLAEEKGWRVVLGTEAVIWQGVEQHRLWTGREMGEIGVEECKEVFARALEGAGKKASVDAGSKL